MDQAPQDRFQEIYRDNQDRIYRLCRAYLGPVPEADDLFQEIFLRVWQHLPQFRGASHVNTWVYRIGVNTALLWRKRQAKRKDQFVQGAEADHTPGDLAPPVVAFEAQSQHPQLKALLTAVSQLKELDRLIISMSLEGFAYQEIAEATGLKANHVGVKLNRIKQRLKQKLNKQNGNGI